LSRGRRSTLGDQIPLEKRAARTLTPAPAPEPARAICTTIRSDGGGALLVSTVSVVNARAGARNSPRDCIVGDCIFSGLEFHVLIVHVRDDEHAKSC
jgi:hypothetical protein